METNSCGRPARRQGRTSFAASLVAATSVLAYGPAFGQQPPTGPAATGVEEIVVTGTRVIRDGYEAPTPLTVVGVEEIEAAAPANIADFVNTLPTLAGSTVAHDTGIQFSGGTAGQNNLNLRGLGTNRTLVLLDGQRVVGAALNGAVDVNGFPDALVTRVDVVTGGASAAYGSDALAGVVNFVLDHEFVGLKGTVQGGITTYGDDANYKIALAGGTNFAGGRGHLMISGEYGFVAGIRGNDRRWNAEGWMIMNNPAYTATNGLPRQILRNQVALSDATPGGIITAGPLKGTYFGEGGVPGTLNYGPVVSPPLMQGGDWQYTRTNMNVSLDSRIVRHNLFAHASYDLTDGIQVFAQGSYAFSDAYNQCCTQFNIANLSMRADNPFLPAEVAARAAALGITSFTLGTMNRDFGLLETVNGRALNRYVVGLNGTFDAFGSDWSWEAYFQHGWVRNSIKAPKITVTTLYRQAIDAARHPVTGLIVCRSTLTNPNDGCVPYNIFGVGVNSDAARNWISGASRMAQRFKQNVYSASVTGEPFSNWAGPVSLAMGAEHRTEATWGINDPISQISGFFVGNYRASTGAFDVTEGFVETVLPVAKDQAWARALDVNAAVRATSYSTSGLVTTWKVGATYAPVDDLRFRVTRSRDIRAPNLADGFTAGQSNTNNVVDPFRNNITTNYQGLAIGNPDLEPEKGDTTGIGLVYQPSWFPGFSGSVDYFNIDIKGVIASISAQETLNRCFEGNSLMCERVTRDAAGNITRIVTSPVNLAKQNTRGIDIDLSYRASLDTFVSGWEGDLMLRALATHAIRLTRNDGLTAVTDSAGSNFGAGPANWRWLLQANYSRNALSASLVARIVSAGVYNTAFIECTTGCPPSTTTNMTIDNNRIPGATYFDLSLTYEFADGESAGIESEAFLTIQNLMNKDPAVAARGPGNVPFLYSPANASMYDVLGRQFRAGVRFRM
ncbi:MAG: TonB-dependent receptor plug domain-containing protein [Rhodospirillaceae bacterium]